MSVKVSSSSKPTFSSHVYTKPADVVSAARETNAKGAYVGAQLAEAKAQLGIEKAPNDKGATPQSSGFNLWKAGAGMAAAAVIGGPVGAAIGAASAVHDAVSFATQKAADPFAEYAKSDFGPITKNKYGRPTAQEDAYAASALRNYTDAEGQQYNPQGYRVTPTNPLIAAAFGSRPAHDINGTREERDLAKSVATLEKQKTDLDTQGEYVTAAAKSPGMEGINVAVAKGPTPPKFSIGMGGPGMGMS